MSQKIGMAMLKSKSGAEITTMLDEGVLDLDVRVEVNITNEREFSLWVCAHCPFFCICIF